MAKREPRLCREVLQPQPARFACVEIPGRTGPERSCPGDGCRPDHVPHARQATAKVLDSAWKKRLHRALPKIVEFYDALVKVAGPSTAQLIIEPGEGHFPNFNYNELEAPATNSFAPPLVPVGKGVGR